MAFDSNSENQIGDVAPAASIQKHPAGKFMWSMALGGPLISWIVHHRETMNSQYGFFWPMFAWSIVLNIPCIVLSCLGTVFEPEKTIGIFMILNWVWYIAEIVFMGRLGAGKITDCVPDYNPADYKRRELIGTVVGAALIILGFCTIVLAAVVAAAAEMP